MKWLIFKMKKIIVNLEITSQWKYLSKMKATILAGVAQWIEHRPVNQRATALIPSLEHMLGLPPRSPIGSVREATNHTLMFLSPFFSLPSHLSKSK